MCDPVSIAAVGTALGGAATAVGSAAVAAAPYVALAGTAIGAYGAYQQGKYQQSLARRNAVEAKFQAEQSIERGNVRAATKGIETAGLMAKQQVGIAAGNVDLGVGSALDIVGNTAYFGELDAQTIRENAQSEARGFLNKRADLLAAGDNAYKSGVQEAFSTVLSGTASAVSKYPDFFKPSKSGSPAVSDNWQYNWATSVYKGE